MINSKRIRTTNIWCLLVLIAPFYWNKPTIGFFFGNKINFGSSKRNRLNRKAGSYGSGGRGNVWNGRNNIEGSGLPNPADLAIVLSLTKPNEKKLSAKDVKIKDIKIKSKVLTVRAIREADAATELTKNGVYDQQKIEEFVAFINYWYQSNGYLFSGVKSHLLWGNGTLEIQTFEARLAKDPLAIQFLKKVPISTPTEQGNSTTLSSSSQQDALEPDEDQQKFTLEQMPGNKGKTKVKMLEKALKLESGKVFQWHPERWSAIRNSGIFDEADVRLNLINDEEVQVMLTCLEAQTASFAPGITKSISDQRWGADVVFEDKNFLGTAKVVGLDIKRSVKDPFTSAFCRLSDSKFNLGPGYLTSAFRECTQDKVLENRHRQSEAPKQMSVIQRVIGNFTSPHPISIRPIIRNGISFQMRWPSADQTKTLGGTAEVLQKYHEHLASDAQQANEVVVSINHERAKVWNREWGQSTGRLSLMAGIHNSNPQEFLQAKVQDLFYKASASISHVIPLDRPLLPSFLAGTDAPTLALLHSGIKSTSSVPSHYAAQLGGPFSLRGFFTGELGVPTSALHGTTELRVPVKISDDNEVIAIAFIDYGVFNALHNNGGFAKDCVLSHGVGVKMGIFRIDYAVTDTGDARVHFGLPNPLF